MRTYHVFKRIVDIFVSFIGILILSPFWLLLAVWIKLSSRGPVIYKHRRVGKNEKIFDVYKFRTMVYGARLLQKKGIPNEKLITSAGKLMRKTFLDETLQLLNVLKGDISLVGPRPFDKEEFQKGYTIRNFPKLREVIRIKPGMTSLDSISNYLDLEDRKRFEKKFKGLLKIDKYIESTHKYNVWSKNYKYVPGHHRYSLDSYYIENESLLLDLKIIFYTILIMFKRIIYKRERERKTI